MKFRGYDRHFKLHESVGADFKFGDEKFNVMNVLLYASSIS